TNLPARKKNPRFGALPGTVPNNIMGAFAPETLPILCGLARGFAVCDHWFASVPTETMPNRAFMCAATSQGKMGDSNVTPFTVKSNFRPFVGCEHRLDGLRVQWGTFHTHGFPRHIERTR